MDFDDLLLKTNELLNRFPEVLGKYQNRFRYILVDEYQDTNHSQYLIGHYQINSKICVVGDDAQSIYAFRGANINNILNFQKDYEGNLPSGTKLPFDKKHCGSGKYGHR
jgi:DNA helicase-2/ATP-dependent DNA helicase PcrA